MCYVNCVCDGCSNLSLCVRIGDGVYCADCARINAELADEYRDNAEDDFDDFGIDDDEDDIDPEFDYAEDDGQPSTYDEYQDLYGGDDAFIYEGTDYDFGMDG